MSINRILVGLAVVILLIIIGIIVIVGGGGEKPPTADVVEVRPLPEYSTTNAEVSMTVRGIINGEDLHRSIRITVSQNQRRLDIIFGYSGTIDKAFSFDNSQPAYEEFLYAIAGAGFLNGKEGLSEAASNPKGKCPLGQLSTFELTDGIETVSSLWSSTCGTKVGTLAGSSSVLQQLFRLQITDYNELVSGVQL